MFHLDSLRGAVPALRPRLSTGLASLDAVLGGGLELGQLVEISGALGTGRSSLALSIGLRCLALSQPVVWIEGAAALWPLPLLEAGAALSQLVLLRVPPASRLRALQLLLSSAGAAKVSVVDLGGVSDRELSTAQLVKLQRLAERSATLVLFLTQRPAGAASLGALIDVRLHLRASAPASPASDLFERSLEIQVLRHKHGPSQGHFQELLHGPDRLRLRSTL